MTGGPVPLSSVFKMTWDLWVHGAGFALATVLDPAGQKASDRVVCQSTL